LKNSTFQIEIVSLWRRVSGEEDHAAFESLFHLLNAGLIKFAQMYVHQKEAAEDIVSDVFAQCWVRRRELREVRAINTYLFVAVKNHSLNHLKKYSTLHHSAWRLVQLEETAEVRLVKPPTPEELLEKKELFFKMERAIEELPQQCRIIFRLVKEEGIKHKEVAEILDISPRTVQTQIFRAMKKLSAVLAGQHLFSFVVSIFCGMVVHSVI
jgi:RNA polymerase sigma-70 factor (ECF subfamily)